MASDLVVRYAKDNPGVGAVVAFSLFGQGVTPDNPKNLIVIDGAWESSTLTSAGLRIVSDAAKGNAQEGSLMANCRKVPAADSFSRPAQNISA